MLGRFQDLLVAMKALGLNPTETEIQDLINEVERNGFIYYPAFCRVIMRKLREDDEENFRRELFRTMIGPKKYEDCVAPIYNYSREVLTFEQVRRKSIVSKFCPQPFSIHSSHPTLSFLIPLAII